MTYPAHDPRRLASEAVVVQAPMSFSGSARRIWKLTAAAGPARFALIPLAVALVVLVWCVVACWYVVFGLLLVPYRLIRRGGRNRRRDALQHQEMLRALQRRR